jgi:lipopolysaccharide export system permease protein
MPRLPLFSRIDIYIFRQLLFALVAVTSALVALIWLTQSLRFVELVVNRGLSLGVFLSLTGLLIPSFVAVILPITTFVVVQFVYQRLAGDRELTVMRATGLSPFALSRPALAVALLALGAGYALNLWLVPVSMTAFREYQFEIRNRMAAFLLQDGVFTPVSDDLVVYVRKRDPDGGLHGILVDDARVPNQPATILAERGRIVEGPTGPRVLLQNGDRQELDRRTGRLNILSFSENLVDLSQGGRTDEQRFRDPSEMSINELLHPGSELIYAHDAPKWRAEAHKRLAGPLTTLSFAMLALVSVLTGTFRRHGNVLRPLAAVLGVVALLAAGLAIGNLAARDSALLPLIWLQAVAPGAACAVVLFAPQLLRSRTRIVSLRTA